MLLEQFTAADRAANIPEFVDLQPTAIRRIQEDFLNDYSFVRAGNEFFRSGQADSAARDYRKALQLNPNSAQAHHKLGFLLYNVERRFDEGMQHLYRAVALNPNDGAAQYDLGYAMLHQNRIDEAVGHLGQAVRLLPNGLDKQYNPTDMNFSLGLALMRTGAHEKAAAAFRRVIVHAPNHAEARYRLAMTLAATGQTDEPMAQYARAVELDPKVDASPVFHSLIAENYARRGQFKEAQMAARKALGLARAAGNTQLVYEIMDRLARYQQSANTNEL